LPKPAKLEDVKQEVQEWNVDTDFDWYQNASHVFVSFKIKKGDIRHSLECSIGTQRVELVVQGETIIDLRLAGYVDNHKSDHTVGLKKIELKLKK